MKTKLLKYRGSPTGQPPLANWLTYKATSGQLAKRKIEARVSAGFKLFHLAKHATPKIQVGQWLTPMFLRVVGALIKEYNEHLPPTGGERTLTRVSLNPLVGMLARFGFSGVRCHG